jgi:hypothetical protein
MDFNFEQIDFSKLQKKEKPNSSNISIGANINNTNDKSSIKSNEIIYDKTTTETYRIKRILKIDPLTDTEVPEHLRFEFEYKWQPLTGEIIGKDEVGPLCFNAITLYDYIFSNRFKGLWNPASDGFQGYYGDLVGSGSKLEIKSRGSNPEKYLFRLPIIDCYLHPEHNYSLITMGPILSDEHINSIDIIIKKYHKNKHYLTPLSKLKDLYDKAINPEPDVNSEEYKKLKSTNSNLTEQELKEKFNRVCVDELVKIKY